MPKPTYHTLEEIQIRKDKLQSDIQQESDQIGMLWRRELNHLLELNGMPAYRDKSKKAVAEKLLTAVPEEMLRQQIREELMQRDYTTIAKEIAEYREKKVKAAVAKKVLSRAGSPAGGRRRRKLTR